MKLLSLDIWDTLITRDVHPEQIKFEFAEEYLKLFKNEIKSSLNDSLKIYQLRNRIELKIAEYSRAMGQSGEYKFNDVVTDLMRLTFKDPSHVRPENALQLEKLELEIEKKHCLRNKHIDSIIADLKADAVILISDFYHSADFLKDLLLSVDSPYSSQKIYSSCEHGKNKFFGDLFELAQKESAQFSEHIHIGDNPTADVNSPAKYGIKPIHYTHITKLSYPSHLSLEFAQTSSPSNEISKFHSIFPSFIDWVRWVALDLKFDHVFYCAREGYYFLELHNSQQKLHRNPLAASVVEASRISTYLPSIEQIEFSSFSRLLEQYPDMTLSAFCQTLDVSTEKFENILARLGFKLTDAAIINLPSLFLDFEFKNFLETEKSEKLKNLKNYFEPMIGNNTSVLFVDIGWRGSIVDNLASIFTSIEFTSLYLGLYQTNKSTVTNHKKFAFLFNQSGKHFLEPIYPTTPFEMLTSSPKASIIAYGVTHSASKYRNDNEHSEYRQQVQQIQNNILEFQNNYPEFAISPVSFAHQQARQLAEAPPRSLINLFYLLNHDESFGNGASTKAPVIAHTEILKSVLNKNERENIKKKIRGSAWPAASLRKYYFHLPLSLKNLLK
jgi:FMN phosphatase YigB (HAD superfamily)